MDEESPEAAGASSALVPDDKDWTWTLERPCPQCGLDVGGIPAGEIGERVTAYTRPWVRILTRADVRRRPDPATWSPLEYACHVRDVCTLFARRATLMLAGENPTFENWDQDRTAVEERYAAQDPATVAVELTAAAITLATTFSRVAGAAWDLPGERSDGSRFTVLSLGRYLLHDLAHHLWDVGAEVP